jgi:hypothetical protein
MDDVQAAQPTGNLGPDELATLTDEEIETRAVGFAPSASLDDDTDTGDTGDTGDDAADDSGDDSDTGDAGDDTGDTGDDSDDDSGDSDA